MTDRLAYRIDEVCKMLGIRRSTFYRWAESGEMTILKIGGMTFVNRNELERLTKVRIPTPDPPPALARDVEDHEGASGTYRDS